MSNTPRTNELKIGLGESYHKNFVVQRLVDEYQQVELELQQLRRENVELELAVSNYKQALEKVDAWLGPSSDAIVYTVSKVLNDEEQPSTQLDAICEVLKELSAYDTGEQACVARDAKQILQSLGRS